jgi:hypothetical protein
LSWNETLAPLDPAELNRLQHRFGYTREEVRMILAPMAAEGKDAVWSMGDDTPLAPLARAPRPVYAFFRQRFAQVTNPPIDPLREAVVLQMHTRLGPWPHIFEPREALPGLSLRSPLLSLAQMQALKDRSIRWRRICRSRFSIASFRPTTRSKPASTRSAPAPWSSPAITPRSAAQRSRRVLDALPIPMAMAVGAVHRALIPPEFAPKSALPSRPATAAIFTTSPCCWAWAPARCVPGWRLKRRAA